MSVVWKIPSCKDVISSKNDEQKQYKLGQTSIRIFCQKGQTNKGTIKEFRITKAGRPVNTKNAILLLGLLSLWSSFIN